MRYLQEGGRLAWINLLEESKYGELNNKSCPIIEVIGSERKDKSRLKNMRQGFINECTKSFFSTILINLTKGND